MTLTFNVYNSLAQKYEQDKLKVQEQTPVYAIIDPATVPLKAISPNKVIIIIAFFFMALIATIGYLFKKIILSGPTDLQPLIRKPHFYKTGIRITRRSRQLFTYQQSSFRIFCYDIQIAATSCPR